MLQQLCVRLHCYSIWPLSLFLSLSPRLPLAPQNSLFYFFFLCQNPVIFSEHYVSLPLSLSLSMLAVFQFLILRSSFFFLHKSDTLILSVPHSMFLCHFLSATCSSFSNSHHSVCSRVSSLFFVPNHFALLMFQGAGTLTGDMEVHLPRQEQPGGTSRNHQLHAHVSWVGFKTTAKRDYLFL